MKIRPLADRVLVRRIKPQDKSAGGIIIPDLAKEKQSDGLVLAVGPGRVLETGKRLEMPVKTGDRVLFGKYAGSDAAKDGDEIILREDDLLAVLEE